MNVMYFPDVHALILFVGVLSLVAAVILRSVRFFILELLLLAAMTFWLDGQLLIVTGVIQLVVGGFLFIRLLQAIDRNYRLVLEKTFQVPRLITGKGSDGSQSTFL